MTEEETELFQSFTYYVLNQCKKEKQPVVISGLPKVIFLAVAEAEGEGGKTSALEVEAEGEAEVLVFCI